MGITFPMTVRPRSFWRVSHSLFFIHTHPPPHHHHHYYCFTLSKHHFSLSTKAAEDSSSLKCNSFPIVIAGGGGCHPTGWVAPVLQWWGSVSPDPCVKNKSKWNRKSAFAELFQPSRPPTRCSKSAFTPHWRRPPCALPPAHQNSGGLAGPILSISILQAVGLFSFLKESWMEFHRAAKDRNRGPRWPLHPRSRLKLNQHRFQLGCELFSVVWWKLV